MLNEQGHASSFVLIEPLTGPFWGWNNICRTQPEESVGRAKVRRLRIPRESYYLS